MSFPRRRTRLMALSQIPAIARAFRISLHVRSAISQAAICIIFVGVATSFGSVYHVSKTGDDNSTAGPFLTINKAAQVAMPGDSVVVHAGTYREWVQPARGGSSEATRITYKAASGDVVVIKGSERVTAWQQQGASVVWKADLPDAMFGSYNPYTRNLPAAGQDYFQSGSWGHYGEVYLDNRILFEKQSLNEVQNTQNSWFTSHSGTTVSIYANFGAANPNTQLAEVNAREAVFGRNTDGNAGLRINYITVDGFRMSQCADQWTPTYMRTPNTKGVIFASGAAWIIQNCRVDFGKMRGIVIDIGKDTLGNHIIRNNVIKQCGIAGIGGQYSNNSIICGNWIEDINGDRPYYGVEQGGIKIHECSNMTIAGNVIYKVKAGGWAMGIWLDWPGTGCRVTGNVLIDVRNEWWRPENSSGNSIADNNIAINCGGAHCEDNNLFAHNLLYNTSVKFAPGYWTDANGNPSGAYDQSYNNMFLGRSYDQFNQRTQNASDYNAFVGGASKTSWGDAHSVTSNIASNFLYTVDTTAKTVALSFNVPNAVFALQCPVMTSQYVGVLHLDSLRNPDRSLVSLGSDIFGTCRGASAKAGPFQTIVAGANSFVLRPTADFDWKAACLPVTQRFDGVSIAPARVSDLKAELFGIDGRRAMLHSASALRMPNRSGVRIVRTRDGNGSFTVHRLAVVR